MDCLKEINAEERIRDPIYGFIFLTKAECELIDLPIFQRLRRIHQLALTKYVYPSAEHSRFVHSLGVMHAATMIFQELYKNNNKIYEDTAVALGKLKILRVAALLHDIGHVPFSHAAETILLSGGKHEGLSKYIIENDVDIQNLLKKHSVDVKEVSALIAKTSSDIILQKILSDEFDADRADYLLRDSHCCGVQYGMYDFIRYVGSFIIEKSGKILIKEDNIPVVEALITARYYYNQQVVYHRTRQAYNIALRMYIKEKKDKFKTFDLKKDINIKEDFLWFDDYTIIEQVKKDIIENASQWAPYILRLKHLQCFEQISDSDKDMRNELEKELSSFKIGEDYFTEVTKKDHHQLTGTANTDEHGNVNFEYEVKRRYGGKNKKLMDCSPVLKGLHGNPNQIIRYFCIETETRKFKTIVDKIHGR